MALRNESYPKELHNPEKRIWVTPKEAIRISGIKRTRLYELMNDGTIKSRSSSAENASFRMRQSRGLGNDPG
jgi:hypothetical protein